ncbi:hypothetical protein ACEZCY_03975 [Streptacidiphilus sp. N1-12]|uniref:Anti-anti-sigma factor n=2 Tax=Streptacidiphilus alkalitolerans TaxID=3342712 RepID=A0ABV6V400_9ACTN
MHSRNAPQDPGTTAPPGAQEERFGQARATHWATATALVLVLAGDLDWRIEPHIGEITRQARQAGLPLAVDLSAVTHVGVDVLALFLDAHTDPGLAFIPPLPVSMLNLLEMTGTARIFSPSAVLPD